MLRQIVIPTENRLTVDLPNEYLNHSVEILVFKLDEAVPVKPPEPTATDPLAVFDRHAGSFDGHFDRDELYDR